MEWQLKRDNRLLLFPGILVTLALVLFFYETFSLLLRVVIVLWVILFSYYFFRCQIKKNNDYSISAIRFYEGVFQVFIRYRWFPVELERGSLVSYWLLALQWKVIDTKGPLFKKSYSVLIFPSSMLESEFRALMRVLHQHSRVFKK